VGALERDDTEAMRFLASGAAWRAPSQLASDRLRGAAQSGDRIQMVQDILRTHLDSSFTVAELAKLAGFSVSHFAALFKATAAGIGGIRSTSSDYAHRRRVSFSSPQMQRSPRSGRALGMRTLSISPGSSAP
jgi:transcriptional regulator GlxA family with amidase domain